MSLSKQVCFLLFFAFCTSSYGGRFLLWKPKNNSKDFSDINNWSVLFGQGQGGPNENDDCEFLDGNKDAEIINVVKVKSLNIREDYTGVIRLENATGPNATTLQIGKLNTVSSSTWEGGEIKIEGGTVIRLIGDGVLQFKGTQVTDETEQGDPGESEFDVENTFQVEVEYGTSVTKIESNILIKDSARFTIESGAWGIKTGNTHEILVAGGSLRVHNGDFLDPQNIRIAIDTPKVEVSDEALLEIWPSFDIDLEIPDGIHLLRDSALELRLKTPLFSNVVTLNGEISVSDSDVEFHGGTLTFHENQGITAEGETNLRVVESSTIIGDLVVKKDFMDIPVIEFVHDADTRELNWQGLVILVQAKIEMNEHYDSMINPHHDVFRINGILSFGSDVQFTYHHTGNYNVQEVPAVFFEVWGAVQQDFTSFKHNNGALLSTTHYYDWDFDPVIGADVFFTHFDPL